MTLKKEETGKVVFFLSVGCLVVGGGGQSGAAARHNVRFVFLHLGMQPIDACALLGEFSGLCAQQLLYRVDGLSCNACRHGALLFKLDAQLGAHPFTPLVVLVPPYLMILYACGKYDETSVERVMLLGHPSAEIDHVAFDGLAFATYFVVCGDFYPGHKHYANDNSTASARHKHNYSSNAARHYQQKHVPTCNSDLPDVQRTRVKEWYRQRNQYRSDGDNVVFRVATSDIDAHVYNEGGRTNAYPKYRTRFLNPAHGKKKNFFSSQGIDADFVAVKNHRTTINHITLLYTTRHLEKNQKIKIKIGQG
jgi:hypothetical protein